MGHATAELPAIEGAGVALADIRAHALEAAAPSIGGEAVAIRMDLAESMTKAAAVAAAQAKLGPRDGLVNCAAILIHADPLGTAWTDWNESSESIFSAPTRAPGSSRDR